MNIKAILNEQFYAIKSIENELNVIFTLLSEGNYDELVILERYKIMLLKYKGNYIVLKHFLDFVRTITSEKVGSSFDLEDIQTSLEALISINKDDLDVVTEYFYFTDAVLADEQKASEILKKIHTILSDKKNELDSYVNAYN